MKLRYTPEAIADLKEISSYINTELRNPKAASRVSKSVLDACADLKRYPEMDVSIEATTGFTTNLRMLVWGNYIALYRMDEDVISVARIIYAKQDYMRILFGELTDPGAQ